MNGDTAASIGFGGYALDGSVSWFIPGVYADKIGVLIGGQLVLAGADAALTNYDVTITPGTLTVGSGFDDHDDYWFSTAPWDKDGDLLRERNAEFEYVGGGMRL